MSNAIESELPVLPQQRSTFLDVGLFVIAYCVGLSLYVSIRHFTGGQAQMTMTVTVVTVMVIYALLTYFVPRLRLRTDQAGDNSYYLGLLFTLTSMAFALWDFRTAVGGNASAAGVRQIIANFGIALATTIAGIVMRVVLHQMRLDPADLEQVTRIELTEAAHALRASVEQVTKDLSLFHVELQQRSRDVSKQLLDDVVSAGIDVSKTSSGTVQRISAAAEKSYQEILDSTAGATSALAQIATEAANAIERLQKVEPPPVTLIKRLDKVSNVLEQLAEQSERTSGSLSAATDASAKAAEASLSTSQALEKLTTKIVLQQENLTKPLDETTRRLASAVDSFGDALQGTKKVLAEVEQGSKTSADAALRAHAASADVLKHLTGFAKDLTAVVNKGASLHGES